MNDDCGVSLESTPSPTVATVGGDGWDDLAELFDGCDEGLVAPEFEDTHEPAPEGNTRLANFQVAAPAQWFAEPASEAEDPDSLVFGSSPSPSNNSDSVDPEQDGGGLANIGGDAREDKKRRNREAAKLSRAKKKRMLQSIEERQEDLEKERSALKRENQSLRYVNQALESQVAYFHSLFKSAFNNGALSKLPETAFDSAWHVPGPQACNPFPPIPAPRSAGTFAMAIVFLATVSIGKIADIELAPPPSMLDEAPALMTRHGGGRTLLAVDDSVADAQQGNYGYFQMLLSMLHMPVLGLAVVILIVASARQVRRRLSGESPCKLVLPTLASSAKNKVQ